MTARHAEWTAQHSAVGHPVGEEVPPPGLWRAITVAEANALLAAGGYGLWVERTGDELRLAGVGSGLPLGVEPTWADLYRALVRLRRTRKSFDAAWLQRLSGSLGVDGGERPDGCPRVPDDRIELVSGPDRELARKSLSVLTSAGHGVPFPARETTVGRRDRAVRLQSVESRQGALRRLDRAERLIGVVANDPDLRMHCATQPVPGAVVDTETGAAAVLRNVEPAPAHPTHPGGTITAGLDALLCSTDGAPGLLRVVLDNRFERGADELDHFLEHFIRPLLRVFRMALDTHDLGLFALDEGGFGFELSPELQATGRIVITDHDRVAHRPSRSEVNTGVRALVATLNRLGDGFAELQPEHRRARIRDSVRRVSTEELRYLAPHTAELLSGEQPLQRYAHTVPAAQDELLKSVLAQVQQVTRQRRFQPSLPQPAVVIDVDGCPGVAGLPRFCWDVWDAGGRVLFRSARDQVDVERVLAESGVLEVTTYSATEIAALEVDVVATFEAGPGARISVRAGGRPEADPERDTAIDSFETRPRAASSGPALSNTHSLEELQIGAMRRNPLSRGWGVQLTESETWAIVDSILADVDRSARRTGRAAASRFGLSGAADDLDRVLDAVHHVLTRKQFIKGSRANYRPADLRRDVECRVRAGEPIDMVLLGFPVKQCLNRLKAAGPLPDLAELGAMARLREMHQAVAAVYPPGLRFNILTDGRHFRTRPASITDAYQRKLREYVDLAGIGDRTTVREIDALAEQRLGPELPAERKRRVAAYSRLLAERLRHHDITDHPLRTLDEVHEWAMRTDEFAPHVIGLFREIFMSLVYSVPVVVPPAADRMEWSRAVYADVYNLGDPSVTAEIRQARRATLRRTWHIVLRYMATMQVDDEFNYERLVPHRVRLTLSAVRPGCLGFTYLGGSGVLPWQGTGVLDPRGHVAVDFAVSLQDQGFVPVYSPLLGPRQPWAMVPAGKTRLPEPASVPSPRGGPASGVRLDEEFMAKARLRRK